MQHQSYSAEIEDVYGTDHIEQMLQEDDYTFSESDIDALLAGGIVAPSVGAHMDLDTDSAMNWLKIWDVKSGQLLACLPAGLRQRFLRFCSEGKFLMALVTEGNTYTLKVWDLSENKSPSLGDDDWGTSEGKKEDDPGKKTTGDSTMLNDCKRSKGKNFVRRLFRRR